MDPSLLGVNLLVSKQLELDVVMSSRVRLDAALLANSLS